MKLIGFPVLSALLGQQSNRPTDPKYASPERNSGHMPDEPGDVYSLAAVLHHLLTGRPPDGSPVRSLPPGMRAVLTQALSPTPGQRFPTVAEFATAVERATAVASRPKRTGANRSLIAVGATLLVIMAGLWLLWSLRGEPGNGAGAAQETATRAFEGVQAGENARRHCRHPGNPAGSIRSGAIQRQAAVQAGWQRGDHRRGRLEHAPQSSPPIPLHARSKPGAA